MRSKGPMDYRNLKTKADGNISQLLPTNVRGHKSSSLSLQSFSSVDEAVAALRPCVPMYCFFPEALAKSARLFCNHFPGFSYYAVKSNSDPYVLKHLYAAGVRHFDVASLSEVELVRGLFPDAKLAFMHPVKSREAIRDAYFCHGVRAFVLDSHDELRKIVEETKNAADLLLIVRVTMPKGSAAHPLSGKFGATPELTIELLREARQFAKKIGLSFHVGSQTIQPESYYEAIERVGCVIEQAGLELDVLDVGGGFPISCIGMDVRPLTEYFDAIREGLALLRLPSRCEIWCEPGAGLAGLSGETVVRVDLRKDDALYINDGACGSLFDMCWDKRRNDVRLIRKFGADREERSVALKPFYFYGPTCESFDKMPGPFMLPENVAEGDWIVISGMGAYGLSFRTHYNGFYSDLKVEIVESLFTIVG